MKYYVYKLLPPRPTFAVDMTAAERELMLRHVDYWRGLMARGWVVVVGPVFDPTGSYGIGVLRLPDDADAGALANDDPCLQAGCGFQFTLAPMPQAIVAPGV
jgi:uncharacterized protein YciI